MTQKTMSDMITPISIIGLNAGGAADLPPRLLERIAQADVLAGGRRHLSYFPDFSGEKVVISGQFEPVIERLRQALAGREKAVVLASGDPLYYGIGAALRRYFPAEQLRLEPAPTAFQLAFAALVEPWQEAVLLSAHAQPLAEIIPRVMAAPKAAILTDPQNTPAVIARRLAAGGLVAETACAVCENLGGSEERIVRTTLAEAAAMRFAPLNVFVVWPKQKPPQPVPPGLPDDAFAAWRSQFTKREIRLLTLAELQLQPGQVMWDIGAGSGAVCIEAARAQPAAVVYAIEKRPALCERIRENLTRFPAPNLHLIEGLAPQALSEWPDPHAVFVGGSGGRLEAIIKTARQRLQPGGRLVFNLAVLDNLATVRRRLPEATVVQIQVNRGESIVGMLRLKPLNPIFIVTWRKTDA